MGKTRFMKLFLTVVAAALTATVVANTVDIDLNKVQSRDGNNFLAVHPKAIGSPMIQGRITNGTLATPKQFPYQCGLLVYLPQGYKAWCGCTLISNYWVVTAAHCADDVKGIDVYLGTTNRTNRYEQGQQIIYVPKRNIFVHEKYNPNTLLNDIAVLQFSKAIEFNEFIRPANLPNKSAANTTYAGARAIAAGWGRISDAAQSPTDYLRWIDGPVMDNEECSKSYGGVIKPSHICISTIEDKKSICSGDSGGPLVLADGSNTLIGAVTFRMKAGCEKGFPGVFTRITSYIDWIRNKTGVANQ